MTIQTVLHHVREKQPLVHNITNKVTINDVANSLLAIGASPIMADEEQEAEEITRICNALLINIGTLNAQTIPAMLKAGAEAKRCGHPVVLDPVGAGASALRTETAKQIIELVQPTVIKCNMSEMRALLDNAMNTKGVDVAEDDRITQDTLAQSVAEAKRFAVDTASVVVVTGAVDVMTDGNRVVTIQNGHPMMAQITGSGCMLGAAIAACVAAGDDVMESAVAATVLFGLCGEKAAKIAKGTGSFRMAFIDALSTVTAETVQKEARYENF